MCAIIQSLTWQWYYNISCISTNRVNDKDINLSTLIIRYTRLEKLKVKALIKKRSQLSWVKYSSTICLWAVYFEGFKWLLILVNSKYKEYVSMIYLANISKAFKRHIAPPRLVNLYLRKSRSAKILRPQYFGP